MFCVSSLLSTQTFLPEPVVFMINSFHLISRPSLYLSVPVMMLSYALAFPPFPLIFITMPHLPLTFIMLSANQALLDKYRLSFPMLPKKNTAYCQVWGLEFERWEGCVILVIIDVQCIWPDEFSDENGTIQCTVYPFPVHSGIALASSTSTVYKQHTFSCTNWSQGSLFLLSWLFPSERPSDCLTLLNLISCVACKFLFFLQNTNIKIELVSQAQKYSPDPLRAGTGILPSPSLLSSPSKHNLVLFVKETNKVFGCSSLFRKEMQHKCHGPGDWCSFMWKIPTGCGQHLWSALPVSSTSWPTSIKIKNRVEHLQECQKNVLAFVLQLSIRNERRRVWDHSPTRKAQSNYSVY